MNNVSVGSNITDKAYIDGIDGIDGIVMLTWSNWFTELRSNRYHYASRFSKLFPVVFVQPDLDFDGYSFEKTELANVTVIHIPERYDRRQTELLNAALLDANVIKPIFWIYNINFYKFLSQRYSLLNIYHGTEDYLASDSHLKFKEGKLVDMFNMTLNACDLLVSVSDGVAASFKQYSTFQGEMHTITNGCDYHFYAPDEGVLNIEGEKSQGTVFYQGNIFDKLDYELLIELAKCMPSWLFEFCGKVVFNEKSWKVLCRLPNVKYLGLLTPEGIRNAAYEATVGIIPFVENEWLIERSFPLKAFEYLACGLPVVSVPIKALLPYRRMMSFASGVEQFKEAIVQAKGFRMDALHTKSRLELAESQGYDFKFEQVATVINGLLKEKAGKHRETSLNIVILYHPRQMNIIDSREYLLNFMVKSRHDVSFISMLEAVETDLMLVRFDALLIYESGSCRADNKPIPIPRYYIEKIKSFGGYKVLLADGIIDAEGVDALIHELGIHAVHASDNITSKSFPDVVCMAMPDNKLMLNPDNIYFDDYLSQSVSGDKENKRGAYVYALVAVERGNSFCVDFEPDDFLILPSKNIFKEDDFSKVKALTPRLTKKLIYEVKIKAKFAVIVYVKKMYNRLPFKQKISKVIPQYIKNKMVYVSH